jgi:hypothetical protein
MPEIAGKKRWEVDPCIITLDDGEKMEDVAVAIIKAAVEEATPGGLGLITAFFQESSGKELISKEDMEGLRTQFQTQGKVTIDYWEGRPVKLYLQVVDPTVIHINVNGWIDRGPGAPREVPPEVIADLQNVLEVASGKKTSANPQERLAKGFCEDEMGPMVMTELFTQLGRRKVSPEEKEERRQNNVEKSRVGSSMKNSYIERLARKIMAKCGCVRERLRISMFASSWLPEMVEQQDWRATVTQIVLPDGTQLPGFTIDNQLDIIKGDL